MRRLVTNSFLTLIAASAVLAQQHGPDASAIRQGLEKEARLLRVLGLEIATFGEPYNASPGGPQPRQQFKSGEPIWVHMTMSNGDSEVVTYGVSRTDRYRHYSPRLGKDGQPVAYLPEVQKKIDDETIPLRGSGMGIRIQPYQRERVGALELQDWYGPLEPGFYELSLGYGFRRGGPRLASNAVTFEVIAR